MTSEPRVERYRIKGTGPAQPLTEHAPLPPALGGPEQEFLQRLEVTACRSGCRTQDHATYGECLKAARFGVAAGETARGQYG